MNLVTVANNNFIPHVLQLIESYNLQPFKKEIFLYLFDTDENIKNKIINKYKNITIIDIPKINEYIYDTKIFLFKCYALKDAINRKINFIYSDAANLFVRDSTQIVDYIYKNQRLFLEYPNLKLKNKYYTTNNCFSEMDCNSSEYRSSQQYWAGLQGYINNDFNIKFINEMYDLMLNEKIAFPRANIFMPDGDMSDCIYHRNEQSVLSLLIKKYNIEQKFDYDMFNKCGDYLTIFNFDEFYKFNFNFKNILICSRYSNVYGFNYLDRETRVSFLGS